MRQMGPRAREHKRYHHGDLRHALIHTGLEVIDREGLQALSIRRLAAKIGVSHTAPIYHFANKNELIGAIATEGFRIYNRTVAPVLEEPDPRERFVGLGRRYFQFASEHSAYYRLIFGPSGDTWTTGETDELAEESSRAFESLLSTVAYYLQSNGVNGSKADFEKRVRMTSIMTWAHVHGTVMLWFNDIWSFKFPGIDSTIEQHGYLAAFRPMVENTLSYLLDHLLEFATGDIADWDREPSPTHTHWAGPA